MPRKRKAPAKKPVEKVEEPVEDEEPPAEEMTTDETVEKPTEETSIEETSVEETVSEEAPETAEATVETTEKPKETPDDDDEDEETSEETEIVTTHSDEDLGQHLLETIRSTYLNENMQIADFNDRFAAGEFQALHPDVKPEDVKKGEQIRLFRARAKLQSDIVVCSGSKLQFRCCNSSVLMAYSPKLKEAIINAKTSIASDPVNRSKGIRMDGVPHLVCEIDKTLAAGAYALIEWMHTGELHIRKSIFEAFALSVVFFGVKMMFPKLKNLSKKFGFKWVKLPSEEEEEEEETDDDSIDDSEFPELGGENMVDKVAKITKISFLSWLPSGTKVYLSFILAAKQADKRKAEEATKAITAPKQRRTDGDSSWSRGRGGGRGGRGMSRGGSRGGGRGGFQPSWQQQGWQQQMMQQRMMMMRPQWGQPQWGQPQWGMGPQWR